MELTGSFATGLKRPEPGRTGTSGGAEKSNGQNGWPAKSAK